MSEAAKTEQAAMVTAPRFYANAFQGFMNPTDYTVVLGQLVPAMNGGQFSGQIIQSVAVVSMSPQAAKELAHLLNDAVKQFEASWGEIRTPFLEGAAKK